MDFPFQSSEFIGIAIESFIIGLIFGKNINYFMDYVLYNNHLLSIVYAIGYSIFAFSLFNSLRRVMK